MMFDRLRQLEERYHELDRLLADPGVIAQQSEYARYAKARAEIEEVVEGFERYKRILAQIGEAKHILAEESDRELRELAEIELRELTAKEAVLQEELKRLLLPRDPNDAKNVFVEIRAGAGGDEAGLFAAGLAKAVLVMKRLYRREHVLIRIGIHRKPRMDRINRIHRIRTEATITC